MFYGCAKLAYNLFLHFYFVTCLRAYQCKQTCSTKSDQSRLSHFLIFMQWTRLISIIEKCSPWPCVKSHENSWSTSASKKLVKECCLMRSSNSSLLQSIFARCTDMRTNTFLNDCSKK